MTELLCATKHTVMTCSVKNRNGRGERVNVSLRAGQTRGGEQHTDGKIEQTHKCAMTHWD